MIFPSMMYAPTGTLAKLSLLRILFNLAAVIGSIGSREALYFLQVSEKSVPLTDEILIKFKSSVKGISLTGSNPSSSSAVSYC